jgi:flagellar hook-basal body complex protein FliE
MAVNMTQALNAYRNAATAGTDTGLGPTEGQAGGPSFSDVLGEAAQSAINTQRHAESAAMQAVSGKADITDVVTAVNAAEITLEAVVALRDKVVQAYQQIMRMPI